MPIIEIVICYIFFVPIIISSLFGAIVTIFCVFTINNTDVIFSVNFLLFAIFILYTKILIDLLIFITF